GDNRKVFFAVLNPLQRYHSAGCSLMVIDLYWVKPLLQIELCIFGHGPVIAAVVNYLPTIDIQEPAIITNDAEYIIVSLFNLDIALKFHINILLSFTHVVFTQ